MPETQPTRVLLIEDDADDASLLVRAMQQQDPSVEVDVARSLAEGLERLGRRYYERVVVDLGLPDASPAEACLMVLDAAHRATVVAISGSEPREQDMSAVAALGGFFLKRQAIAGAPFLSPEDVPLEARPMRILMVEDDPDTAQLVTFLLEQAGLLGHLEHHGRLMPALEAARSGAWDVLLLDLGLPDAPGRLATLDVAVDALPDLAIVVLSGLSETHGLAAVRAGAQDYLPKSILTMPPRSAVRVLQRVLPRAAESAARRRALAEEAALCARIEAHGQGVQQRLREVRGLLTGGVG